MNLSPATTSSCDSIFEAKLFKAVTLCRSMDQQKGKQVPVAVSFQQVIIAHLTGTTEIALTFSKKLATGIQRK
jgi:hypothetical protein